ncbi:MAG: nuclear transport factor 2 family protein [Halobacteria archaeon]|nr:nuclear transport factor 2 family protein [Halobacteria archaeon]
MTETKNVDTVREVYEVFSKGDIEAVVATWQPDIELVEPEGIIGGGSYHGPEEILENVFSGLANHWKDVSVVPERYVDGNNTVVALITWSGTNTETGKSVEFRGVHVFDFKDGTIIQWTSYADTALFNAALEPTTTPE